MGEAKAPLRHGWLPDLPDFRDFTPGSKEVAAVLKPLKVASVPASLPGTVDLRAWCSPIEDQGEIGSCTAQAGMGLIEYFERRAFGTHIDGSRRFLYKVTRNLMGVTGDTGAYLRTTMGAMRLFGVPPERFWPYDTAAYDSEPPAFCYAFAQAYQAVTYYRLDEGLSPPQLVERIKANLAAGLPSMFGFTVYSSLSQGGSGGEIPFPAPPESVRGGHAVVAVGYDDGKTIKNPNAGGPKTKGAFLIRNSWGSSWGDGGYGWLPYEYTLRGLAVDWWSLVKNEYVATQRFGI